MIGRESPPPQSAPLTAPPPTLEQVISFIKNYPARTFRIKISSDSIAALDERGEREDRKALIQSVGSFLQEITAIVEQYPAVAPLGAELLRFVIRSYPGGKELEPVFERFYSGMLQSAKEKEAKAQNEPPDPAIAVAQIEQQTAGLKAQAEEKLIMLKTQLELKKHNDEMQVKAITAQIAMKTAQQDSGIEVERLKLEHSKHQVDTMVKLQELNLKAQEIGSSIDTKAAEIFIKKQSEEMKALLDSEKLRLEELKSQMVTYEALLEEKRLALDQELERAKLSVKVEEVDVKRQAVNKKKKDG